MADEPSRPKLRLTERPPAPPPSPAAPPPTPDRIFRAPALPGPETPAVKLPPPPPPAAAAAAAPRPPLPVAARPAVPPAAPVTSPAERSSVLPLVAALGCVLGAALLYTQVLRPRREAREAAAVPATPPSPSPAAAPALESNAPAALERADPGASPEFRARIANLRLSGVFEGNPPRAMIDGRLVRAGEVIDERLGVRFDGLEPGARLRFRDATGAAVVRRE